MALQITGTTPSAASPTPPTASSASASGEGSFGDTLSTLLASVDESAGGANTAIAQMVAGNGDVHAAMLAMQRAEVAMQLTVQVRNKLVQAYQDLMRMPI